MNKGNAEHKILNYVKHHGAEKGINKYWREFNFGIDSNTYCRDFMQLAVDFMQRSYVIKLSDVENIDKVLIYKIFNSKITEDESTLVNYKQIVSLFINNAFEYDLCKLVVEAYKKLLLATIHGSQQIPVEDKIIGSCFYLLTLLMKPLTDLYRKNLSDTLDPLETSFELAELSLYLPQCLQDIIDLVLGGLIFKDHCCFIGSEFCELVEKYPDYFVNKMAILPKYIQLIEIDNINLMLLTIKSLTSLCRCSNIKEEMIKFFFNSLYETEDEILIPVSEILLQIGIERNTVQFNGEILNLLTVIAELDKSQKFLNKNQRMEIYKCKIVTNNEPTIKNLLKMMIQYEESVYETLVNIFNAIDATSEFVESVILNFVNFRGFKLTNIVNIITANINDPLICNRACQLFKYVHQYIIVPDESSLIQRIHVELSQCRKSETSYGILLDFIMKAPRNLFLSTFSSNMNMQNGLIISLLDSFMKFSYPNVLQKIMQVIKILIPKNAAIKTKLKAVLNQLCEEFIEIDACKIANLPNGKNFENSLVKMNLIFAMEISSFTDYFKYDAAFIINRKHIIDHRHPQFLLFARFHATVLKFSFVYLMGKIQNGEVLYFPMTFEQCVECVAELREKLIQYALKVDTIKNSYDAMLLLTSIFELHYMFIVRPILIENSTRILNVNRPKMEMHIFRKIVDLMAINVASNETSKYNDSSFQICSIDALTEFSKNYPHLSSYFYAFKVIAQYRESELIFSFHMLLKSLLMKPEFTKIIAFTIIDFIIEKKNESNFTLFVSDINQLLEDEEKFNLKINIVKCVLTYLPSLCKRIHSHKNRLAILKHLADFMNKSTRKEADEIAVMTINVTNDLKLKKCESAVIENFIKKIRN